jgi:Fe-S oxidoreductase
MIDLARDNQAFAPVVKQFLRGEPEAILLVEFAGEVHSKQVRDLQALGQLLGDHGLPDTVVEIIDPKLQSAVWTVRKAGLNIMMSMKGDGKPVSFIEDCAVPLEHLAEYTAKLSEVFHKHGTKGTWYAHASVGTLHVRPVLNMRVDGAHKMRAIAEEACALVRQYKGAFSGEHGDGLVRSEWIAPIIGARLTDALIEIKDIFDPMHKMNPDKIVNASKMDDERLFRTPPGYHTIKFETGLDWKREQGLDKAVEMCNNNGHCRKFDADTMCPSYRVTRDEQHLTRGRANTLRLALAGKLGAEGILHSALKDSMDLCVGCKGCKRDCPTGVDMAKMKLEWQYQHKQHQGFRLRDFLIADLPRYAPWVSKLRGLINLRNRFSWLAKLLEAPTGFTAARSLPTWKHPFALRQSKVNGQMVILWVDTFNRYFKPEVLHAAVRLLEALGHTVIEVRKGRDGLCCGRTYLATGMLSQARAEASETLMALKPYLDAGTPIVGLEPSCMLTLRDEWQSLNLGSDAEKLGRQSYLLAEYLCQEQHYQTLRKILRPAQATLLLHGHCHQKAFDLMPLVEKLLMAIPEVTLQTIASSCCGMAGSFGYETEHQETSRAMAELSLLPAVRAARTDTVIVADGFSCAHQIADLSERVTLHSVEILANHLN